MEIPISQMTNRELMTEWELHQRDGRNQDERRFHAMMEMARRLNQAAITEETVAMFRRYKLNGAGDQLH